MRKHILSLVVALTLTVSIPITTSPGTGQKTAPVATVPVVVNIAPVEVPTVTYSGVSPSRGGERVSYSITSATVSEFDLRAYTRVGVNQLSSALQGDLKNKAGLFIQYAEEYDLNCFFIAAVAAQESGWGTSTWAKQNNNYFGYDGGKHYASFEESLQAFCQCISGAYLTEDGPFFNGYTVDAVNQRYCLDNGLPDTDWGKHIKTIMIQLHDNAMSVELND